MSLQNLILAAFLLLKFILQYNLISPEYELQRDEYLHLDQANHLAWGYLSVPPVTSWISLLIKWMGNSVFWVKFFPALFGALTLLVVWKTIEVLKGDLFALVLGATAVLFSILLRLNILFQPNSLDVFCWTTVYFFVVKYLSTERPRWLYAGSMLLALGFLNKYNIVFLLLGLLPAALLVRERRLFLTKHVVGAGLLALLLVLPNLWWQYQNGFPVVHHMSELAARHLVNVNPVDFLKSQLVFFLGALPVLVAGLVALFTYKPFRPYRLLGWSFCFTLALFLYFKAKDYYAIGLYPIYLSFGATVLSEFTQVGWKRLLRPVALLLPLLVFIPMYQLVFPNKSPAYIVANQADYKAMGLLRWEDGKDHHLPQDFADMLGWKELAEKVDKQFDSMPDKTSTLVLCDNYGQAGAINFYSKEGVRAVSFNADYLNWFDLGTQYQHLIRVKEGKGSGKELAETSPFFERAILADSIVNPYARELGTKIFRFTGAKININRRIEEEIEAEKSRWR